MSKIIIENLEKIGISRNDLVKAGFSPQKYDDVLRGKSSYKVADIIKISEKFQLSLDYLILGKSNNLTENEIEMLKLFEKFPDREQLKIIGRLEGWLSNLDTNSTIQKSAI